MQIKKSRKKDLERFKVIGWIQKNMIFIFSIFIIFVLHTNNELFVSCVREKTVRSYFVYDIMTIL